MSDEANAEVLAGDTAPELEVTAPPPPEVEKPEDAETPAPKTFTQEELDAAVTKRLAREQRKWERQQAQLAEAARQPKPLPAADTFESPEAYAEALAEQKALELVARRDAEREQTARVEAYYDREEEALGKYDDFKQVAYNPNLPITDAMAETIQASEVGPDVLYHLGSNPTEAARIAKMSPLLQAREIGKIEAALAANPPVKKTTNAPAPLSPVTPRGNGAVLDTTDPRSIKTMSTSDWIAAERARQMKKLGG